MVVIEQVRKILFLMAWKISFVIMSTIKTHLKHKLL